MPFKSFAQMAYLRHNHPKIYAEWVHKYGKKVPGNKLRVNAVKKG